MIGFSWISQPPLVKRMARFRKYNLNSKLCAKGKKLLSQNICLTFHKEIMKLKKFQDPGSYMTFFFSWRKWFPFNQISMLTMRTTCGYFLHCSWKVLSWSKLNSKCSQGQPSGTSNNRRLENFENKSWKQKSKKISGSKPFVQISKKEDWVLTKSVGCRGSLSWLAEVNLDFESKVIVFGCSLDCIHMSIS